MLHKRVDTYGTNSLRKHLFLYALRRWGHFARRNDETSPAAKSEEKGMFLQAMAQITRILVLACIAFQMFFLCCS